MDSDCKAVKCVQEAIGAEGTEAHSCQDLLKADSGLLTDNPGIVDGLQAQLRESQEADAALRWQLENAKGRVTDAQARAEGCRTREASLAEAGARAARDI